MSAVNLENAAPRVSAAQQGMDRSYLYGPVLDFLLLGGGSLVALLVLRLFLGNNEEDKITSLVATIALANIINNPHFAHSYQIFFANYRAKLFSPDYAPNLRLRYFLVGVVAPVAIVAFLTWAVASGQPRILGLSANAMFFLVGWHYVKQGYGMAMVDAVLKRAFYSEPEKRALLANAYAVWILSWLLVNYLVGGLTKTYFSIHYFVVPVATPVLTLAAAICACTTVWSAMMLWKRRGAGKAIAWNGLLAYGVSLYAWLLVRDPIVLLWVPLFHSLQYLAVVWRFQSNRVRAASDIRVRPGVRMFVFVVTGLVLGYVGFWLFPEWLSANVPYDEAVFGSELYFFLFWIFINIHHYLLDTVMWRKGNPDVAKYLFAMTHKP